MLGRWWAWLGRCQGNVVRLSQEGYLNKPNLTLTPAEAAFWTKAQSLVLLATVIICERGTVEAVSFFLSRLYSPCLETKIFKKVIAVAFGLIHVICQLKLSLDILIWQENVGSNENGAVRKSLKSSFYANEFWAL